MAALVLGIGVAFGTAEILVRQLTAYNSPTTVRENSLEYRPAVFARHLLRPDQSIDTSVAWGRPSSDTASRRYAINELGYRGRLDSVAKEASTCRILVIGGSAVFDIAASEGQDWPHLLQNELRKTHQSPVEVLNAGIPGHASGDAIGRLYTQLWMYEPDVVLLYNAWNDIKWFHELTLETPLIDLVRPYDDAADPFRSYRGRIDRLLSYSQFYVKLRTRYYLWRYDVGEEGSDSTRPLADSFSPLAIEQYRINIQLFTDAVRAMGALPVLLTQATLVHAQASPAARSRIAYGYVGLTHGALLEAFAAVYDVIKDVGRENDVPVIDVAATLSGRDDLFQDHVHTNGKGSRALATTVAESLAPIVASCP